MKINSLEWYKDYQIIGVDNCKRCQHLKDLLPSLKYTQLPDISLGLGDTIHRITLLFNIKKCSSCYTRHYWLNKLFPYFWRGDRHIRKVRSLLVKLKITEYPAIISTDYQRVLDLKNTFPDFFYNYMAD